MLKGSERMSYSIVCQPLDLLARFKENLDDASIVPDDKDAVASREYVAELIAERSRLLSKAERTLTAFGHPKPHKRQVLPGISRIFRVILTLP